MKLPIPFFRRRKEQSTDLTRSLVGQAVGTGPDSPFVKFSVRSLVSEGMEVRGDLVSKYGAALDGVVLGNIMVQASNAALLIRATSRVEGNIDAPQVLVAGEVVGDITARFVRLYPGSRVFGRVKAARLLVDDGAVIDNDAIKVEAAAPSDNGTRSGLVLAPVRPAEKAAAAVAADRSQAEIKPVQRRADAMIDAVNGFRQEAEEPRPLLRPSLVSAR